MLFILLSYFYILFTTQNFGFVFYKLLKFNASNFILKTIFGLFSVTILATIWAVFGRINIEFHLFLLAINFMIFIKYKSVIINEYKIFITDLKNLSQNLKILLSIIAILIVAQCSTAPYLADNESYYIQTIKWLNEYGLVKGLVNLHIFLGQTSGWHICQSAFSFSFLYKNFNDLSGFCLLLGNVFAVQKLDLYFKNGNKNNLIIGLIPLFNLFFFRFISSPSPDIPVYIFSFIVFYLFIENYKNTSFEIFKLITILVLFILFIKTTTAAIVLIPIILFVKDFKKLLPKIVPITIISFVVLSLYIIKNVIVTGYPLYPIQVFGFTNLDYCVPKKMIQFLFDATQADAYWLSAEQYKYATTFELIKRWFTATIIDSFFNFMTLIILLITSFFIHKYKNEKAVWIIYFITIFQMILMIMTSPQYRYFIHFILFFGLMIFTVLCSNKKIILGLNYLFIIPILIVLFIPINFNTLANNEVISKNQTFAFSNIIFPNENSNLNTDFEVIENGNLKYHSPVKNSFFWGAGNGDLPAQNKLQIEYFEQYYFIIPQQRSKNLKDGFSPLTPEGEIVK